MCDPVEFPASLSPIRSALNICRALPIARSFRVLSDSLQPTQVSGLNEIICGVVNSKADGSGLRMFRELIKTSQDVSVSGSRRQFSGSVGPSGHARCEWASSHPSKPKLHKSTEKGSVPPPLELRGPCLPAPQILALRLKWDFHW